jgi:phosphoribosylformylglycinamidine synthase
MTFKTHINIMPLRELLDPQGKAVAGSLHNLGLYQVADVRIGKHITLHIDCQTEQEALEIATRACNELLANAVMESYDISIESE